MATRETASIPELTGKQINAAAMLALIAVNRWKDNPGSITAGAVPREYYSPTTNVQGIDGNRAYGHGHEHHHYGWYH